MLRMPARRFPLWRGRRLNGGQPIKNALNGGFTLSAQRVVWMVFLGSKLSSGSNRPLWSTGFTLDAPSPIVIARARSGVLRALVRTSFLFRVRHSIRIYGGLLVPIQML